MLTLIVIAATIYGIGLRADRIHAQRTGGDAHGAISDPLRATTGRGAGNASDVTNGTARSSLLGPAMHAQRTVKEPELLAFGHAAGAPKGLASGSSTVRDLPHSAGYYAWQLRVRTRQYREAHHYARVLERYIRARRHPAPTRTLSSSSPWDSVAQCESGGNWAYSGSSGFEGGLQFLNSTWIANGGGRYAAHAYDATREEQITIAERVLAASGWGQWPACSAKLGLR